jgi:hypothetical protein
MCCLLGVAVPGDCAQECFVERAEYPDIGFLLYRHGNRMLFGRHGTFLEDHVYADVVLDDYLLCLDALLSGYMSGHSSSLLPSRWARVCLYRQAASLRACPTLDIQ